MTNTTTPRALAEYRALSVDARATYDHSGKRGAPDVRRLQDIALRLAAVRRAAENHVSWYGCAVSELYRGAGYTVPDLVRDRAQRMHTIPLGPVDSDLAKNAAMAARPHRKNWINPTPSATARVPGATVNIRIDYRGAHRGRIGYNYSPTMQSSARIITDGALLAAVIGHTCVGGDGQHCDRPRSVYTVAAGRGYRWTTDSNGVRLVRLADGADYHPNSDEIRAGRAAIVAALRDLAVARKRAAAAAKRDARVLAAASKNGVYVCLADSIAAGNCRTGTESFARRHGLDVRRHYRAETVPRDGGDNDRRVALAVLAAQRRQARDMARGYSDI